MTPRHTRTNWARLGLATTSVVALLVIILMNSTDVADNFSPKLLNVLISSVVFLQGLAVLQVMWRFEIHDANGTLPFAWSYFAIQHLAFGFGGLLISISDQEYLYQNSFGNFPWNEAIIPLLLVHFAAVNAGLFGVWAGTRGRRVRSSRLQPAWEPDRWPWEVIGPVCYVSLFIHGVVWLLLVDTKFGLITYVVQALSYCTNATFLLWGLTWKQSHNRKLFLAYLMILTAIEMLRGNRTFFAFPILLFGIGLLISYSGSRTKMRAVATALPFAIVLFWGFVKSEDVRQLFSRGDPTNREEAVARAESLAGSDSYVARDAAGTDMNSMFRIGARLFELSAADVTSRTPSVIPFWGWTEDDWSILGTGFLPLKLNSDAGAFTIDDAGDGFLREYGWIIESGEGGTTMPATIAGDSWRRFGWAGVIITFLIWSWFLSKITIFFHVGRTSVNMAIFSTGILANTAFFYTTDMTTLVTSMPRRLIVVGVYTAITIGLSKFLERRQHSGKRPRYSVALPL